MRASETRRGGRWLAMERMEAEPEPSPPVLEPDSPTPPAKCPFWVAARMDENTLQVLAGMFHTTVFDFEARFFRIR